MDSNEKLNIEIQRHSLCHVMTLAVKRLFNHDISLGVGPIIDNGFYQDFDYSFTLVDLQRIEDEMHKIINEDLPFLRTDKLIEDAKSDFLKQPFKLELLDDIEKRGTTRLDNSKCQDGEKSSSVSVYLVGSHLDLCRGPHVNSSGQLQNVAFKLSRIAGAYWRGDEKNKMLSRIYGLAFASQEKLSLYLERLDEAKKRDHRILGERLGWFFFHETAPGMAYWLPKGLKVKNLLIEYWRQYHAKRDYQEISAPLINKKSLWEISGHWEHYKDDMIMADMGDDQEWAIKPMNCANAMVVWQSKQRSYRELPLRLSDTDTLHRSEPSGSLQGLMRSRCFCQDDSHNFVAEDKIQAEIEAILEIVKDFYGVFGLLENVKLYLATRPDEFMGTLEEWDRAEGQLLDALKNSGIRFGIKEKDGAFYAPKIDIHLEDALGREWQCGTIQADYQLPQNFGLEYVDSDGSKRRPVVIHRVVYGSIERFLGILIEHTAGLLPFWIAPVQVRVLPLISGSYVSEVVAKLRSVVLDRPLRLNELRVEVDDKESLSHRIRDAELAKVPVIAIIGEKEAANRTVTLRSRLRGEQISVALGELDAYLREL